MDSINFAAVNRLKQNITPFVLAVRNWLVQRIDPGLFLQASAHHQILAHFHSLKTKLHSFFNNLIFWCEMNLLSQKAKTGSSTLDWDIICWNTWIKQWRNKLCKHFCSRWCSLCGYTILLHYFDKIWNRCNAKSSLLGPCHSQNPVESSKLERRTRFTYCFTEFLSSHANVRHTHSVFWQETWKLVCRLFWFNPKFDLSSILSHTRCVSFARLAHTNATSDYHICGEALKKFVMQKIQIKKTFGDFRTHLKIVPNAF